MRDYLSLDGDASETQRVYTGSGLECPTSSEIRDLYSLAPKGACSRGIQAGCERGLSPKSRLCGGQSAGCCSVSKCGGRVCVFGEPALSCEPWLPFYSLKGRQGFT
jgi:hypothetical protein